MADVPLTTGQPDRGAGAYKFTGLRRLAAAWARAGRQLVLVTTAPSALARWGVPTASGTTVEVDSPHGLEVAVNRPPREYRPLRIRLSFAPVSS